MADAVADAEGEQVAHIADAAAGTESDLLGSGSSGTVGAVTAMSSLLTGSPGRSYAEVLTGTLSPGQHEDEGVGSQLPALHQSVPLHASSFEDNVAEVLEKEKKLRRSQLSTVNDDHTLVKTERKAAKKNMEFQVINPLFPCLILK